MARSDAGLKSVFSLLAALLLASPFHGCMTGSEIPNEVVGSVVGSGGKVAPGAEVSLIPADRIPGRDAPANPIASVKTDAQGQYRFLDVPAGTYNVMASKEGLRAFKDSVAVANGKHNLGTDTLEAPGALVGTVRLEAPDSPRLALVQVIGTEIYVNVDSTGRFSLTDMPAGRYRIRVFVDASTYVPEFRAISIRSGRTDTLSGTIAPYYIGEPRITGLKAEALPDGSIRLVWNQAHYKQPISYGVFREPADALFESGNAMAYVQDTAFTDTIYSATPRPDAFGFKREDWPKNPYAGQFPIADTTAYGFRYKVWAFIMQDGRTVGQASEYVKVKSIPPAAR